MSAPGNCQAQIREICREFKVLGGYERTRTHHQLTRHKPHDSLENDDGHRRWFARMTPWLPEMDNKPSKT